MRVPTICVKTGLNKGAWAPEEDQVLSSYIKRHGHWNWDKLPKHAGLNRIGKSCRLRWLNYLRPDLKKGSFTPEEEELVHNLHQQLGNSWSKIAASLPGRSDNEIKNYWHTKRKNRSTQKAKFAPESSAPEDIETMIRHTSSGFGLVPVQKSSVFGNVVVVPEVPVATDRKQESDANAWPDLVELELMLETIASLQKCHYEPDHNITSVLDFPVTPPKFEGFLSPFLSDGEIAITPNQPVEETVIFAEPTWETDGNYWNEMLPLSQNLDMAFVLAEDSSLSPRQPPGEACFGMPCHFYNGCHS